MNSKNLQISSLKHLNCNFWKRRFLIEHFKKLQYLVTFSIFYYKFFCVFTIKKMMFIVSVKLTK